jgi:scavenger receptor class B protein 1
MGDSVPAKCVLAIPTGKIISGILAAGCGLAFFIAGFVINVNKTNDLVKSFQDAQVLTSENAPGFAAWQSNFVETPVEMKLKSIDYQEPSEIKYFYLWNVTNTDDLLNGVSTIPNIEQVGPLAYRVYRQNDDYSWYDDELDYMYYYPWTYYVFVPEKSSASEDDPIINVNVGLQIVLAGLEAVPEAREELLAQLVNDTDGLVQELFVQKTAYEWLWGWDDPILVALSNYLPSVSSWIPGYGKNTSSYDDIGENEYDGIYTGAIEKAYIQELYCWQSYESYVPYWKSDVANAIWGTTGYQFQTGIDLKNDYIYVWDPTSVRMISIWAIDYTQYPINGAITYRFEPDPCTYGIEEDDCPGTSDFYQYGPTGLQNMTVVYRGLELYLSKPHFLDGDQTLIDGVNGVEPDYDSHQTYYLVEPISGATIESKVRAQANYYIQPVVFNDTETWFENINPTYLPAVWSDQVYEINPTTAASIGGQVGDLHNTTTKSRWIYWGCGLGLMLVGVFVFIRGVYETDVKLHWIAEVKQSLRPKATFELDARDEDDDNSTSESNLLGFLGSKKSESQASVKKGSHHRRGSSYGTFKKQISEGLL